jgi:type VI secretion system protein ImpH
MATYGWRHDRPVTRGLFEEGHGFDFFQAVHLLERLLPGRTPVGEGSEPEREPVCFRSHVDLAFPPTDIARIAPPVAPDTPARVTVHLMGLAGALGPLPRPLTEHILERSRDGDTAFEDFLNIFNHRLVSLLYRARKRVRPALDPRPPDQGRVAGVLMALLGLGTLGLQDRMHLADRSLLAHAGLFAMRPRSMVGLEQILSDCFGAPACIMPFQGRWLPLDGEGNEGDDQRTRIGRSGRNQRLGQGAVLGSRVWDVQSGCRIDLGPLDRRAYMQFLPGARGHGALGDVVRLYAGDETSFRLRLTLRADQVPRLRLSRGSDARLGWGNARLGRGTRAGGAISGDVRLSRSAGGARLGWTSWLVYRPWARDVQATVPGNP